MTDQVPHPHMKCSKTYIFVCLNLMMLNVRMEDKGINVWWLKYCGSSAVSIRNSDGTYITY